MQEVTTWEPRAVVGEGQGWGQQAGRGEKVMAKGEQSPVVNVRKTEAIGKKRED